jgi:hypothetical protein
MPFNFRVVFNGLCAFVPNRPIAAVGLLPEKPTEMDIVLVDARMRTTAIDGGALEPHYPVAVIKSANLKDASGVPPGTRLEWRLDRRELTFAVQDGTPREFVLVQGAVRGAPPQGAIANPAVLPADTPKAADDFAWGAHMQLAAPNFARIDPRCFQDAGSLGLISARVLVRRGEMSTRGFDPERTARYSLDATLGGGTSKPRPFTNKASLEIEGVTAIRLIARDMDDLLPHEEIALTGPENEWVEITIANADDGRLPERLPNPTSSETEDKDFRWFYSLCADRDRLGAALNQGSLPIPIRQGGAGPGAVVCMNLTFDGGGGQ